MALLLHQYARSQLRRERVFKDRCNPLEDYDDISFTARYRLPKLAVTDLLRLIGPELDCKTEKPTDCPALLKFLCALRFYATGSFLAVIGDIHGLSKSSISRYVRDVSMALTKNHANFIQFPETSDDCRQVMLKFEQIAGFPNVLGAIDGTHIPILAPREDEPLYVNRKGFHSINVMAICDADQRFTSVVAKYPGSAHDSFVLSSSAIYEKFENRSIQNGWLLGDSGYALKPWLFTPVANEQTQAQRRYNVCHSKTRSIIERCFGSTKMQFRCLDKTGGSLLFSPIRTCRIIISCFILHNILIDRGLGSSMFGDDSSPDSVEENDMQESASGLSSSTRCTAGHRRRQQLIDDYFAS